MPTSPLPFYDPAVPSLLTTGLQHNPALRVNLDFGPDAQALHASEAQTSRSPRLQLSFEWCSRNVGVTQKHFDAEGCIKLTLLRMISGAK